jgi:hypothetical protein
MGQLQWNSVIAPVGEDLDDVVVLFDSLHQPLHLQTFGEKRLIGDGRSIRINAKCSSKKQLAMLCYHRGVSISHLRSIGSSIPCNACGLNSTLLESGHSFFKCCNGANCIFDGLPSTSNRIWDRRCSTASRGHAGGRSRGI